MTLYSKEQKDRARYLSLQKQREIQMAKKISMQFGRMKSRVLFNGRAGLSVAINRALMIKGRVSVGVLRQRIMFAKKITAALRSSGLGVPSMRGISLTRAMRTLIKKIIRKKNDIWMFKLREQWLNNERAKILNGGLATESAWLNTGLRKIKSIIITGREHTSSQHNDYFGDKIKQWQQTINDGKYHSRGLFNANSN